MVFGPKKDEEGKNTGPGISYSKDPCIVMEREFGNGKFLSEIEDVLDNYYENIDAGPLTDNFMSGERPVYSINHEGKKIPKEIKYEMDGTVLTISHKNSSHKNEVEITVESMKEEKTRDLFKTIEEMYEEVNSESESFEEKGNLRYDNKPLITHEQYYRHTGFLADLEKELEENFDQVCIKENSSSMTPENPVYGVTDEGSSIPKELTYEIKGAELTVSKYDARGYGNVKLSLEAEERDSAVEVWDVVDKIYSNFLDQRETENSLDYSWDDIGGLEEQKEEIRKYLEWPLKNPGVFEELDIEPPRGILLYGPPGTGKTLIAKTVASETDAAFFNASVSELTSKYYGESSDLVDSMFRKAKSNSPSVVFLDEVESLFRERNDSYEATQRVVGTFLKNMDGVEELKDVVVIGATNRREDIDEAILRSGRMGREIYIPEPDREGREEILKIHTRNTPVKDVDYEQLSKETEGLTGADIKELVNEAGFQALKKRSEDVGIEEVSRENLEVEMDDFYQVLREKEF